MVYSTNNGTGGLKWSAFDTEDGQFYFAKTKKEISAMFMTKGKAIRFVKHDELFKIVQYSKKS